MDLTTQQFIKVDRLVAEYREDPNCKPHLWVKDMNLTDDERFYFLQLTTLGRWVSQGTIKVNQNAREQLIIRNVENVYRKAQITANQGKVRFVVNLDMDTWSDIEQINNRLSIYGIKYGIGEPWNRWNLSEDDGTFYYTAFYTLEQ